MKEINSLQTSEFLEHGPLVLEPDILYNGSGYNLLIQLGNDSVDCILCDPPYDFTEDIRAEYHRQFTRVCKGPIIVFSPPENLWQAKADQTLFWIKPISTKNTSRSYSRFVEVIQVWNGSIPCWNANRNWSQYTNVFTDIVEDAKLHPYTKPLSMITRLLLNHTNENAVVLDPFLGSGTTALACVANNRYIIGCEIDTDRFNNAIDRLKRYERRLG